MDDNAPRAGRADDLLFQLLCALSQLLCADLSVDERVVFQQEFDALKQQLARKDRLVLEQHASVWRTMEETRKINEFFQFALRMFDRQGSRVPDFDALYRQKAELDRRFENP